MYRFLCVSPLWGSGRLAPLDLPVLSFFNRKLKNSRKKEEDGEVMAAHGRRRPLLVIANAENESQMRQKKKNVKKVTFSLRIPYLVHY